MSKKPTPIAIAYDFDGTLAPGNMQEYDFIPALRMKSGEFWNEVKHTARQHETDEILAYMWLMLSKADAAKVPVREADFVGYGAAIDLFPGVEEWFERINRFARARNCMMEHFIISSGLREMIRGTKIGRRFKKIYGSGFMFDHNGIARWPAVAMNYTTKTQYLFRINKGSLDVHDNSVINKFVPMDARPVPFQNIIYMGDGETDIPCMRLVKDLGGHAIAVFNSRKRGSRDTAAKLVAEGRATLSAPADYRPASQIENAINAIIEKIAAEAKIRHAAAGVKSAKSRAAIDPLADLKE
jgi:hypothetical protein